MEFKKQPLSKAQIDAMKNTTPQLYEDMVGKYGEDNVINNILIDLVCLTEDKNLVTAKDNEVIIVNKELINKVKIASNSAFKVYLKEPINKLKSWITDGDSSFGYTPINKSGKSMIIDNNLTYSPMIYDHAKVQDRIGYILGGSYYTLEKDKKLHLLCKAILISPEAKYNYIIGLLREDSPTLKGDYTISEMSFVNIPAQMTNTSLSSGDNNLMQSINIDNQVLENNTNNQIEEPINWTEKIEQARKFAEQEKEEFKIKQKTQIAENWTEKLLQSGAITSSQRRKYNDMFIQLSSGQEDLVGSSILNVKSSLFRNKPKQVFLQGNLFMNKSITEQYTDYSKEHAHKYTCNSDLRAAFEKHMAQMKISLSAGDGSLIDPIEDIMTKLRAMKEHGSLTDEHKKILGEFCYHDGVSMSDNGMVGDGKPVEGGGIAIPNNTSLSAAIDTLPASNNLIAQLEAGFNSEKLRADKLDAELLEQKNTIQELKKTLGVI